MEILFSLRKNTFERVVFFHAALTNQLKFRICIDYVTRPDQIRSRGSRRGGGRRPRQGAALRRLWINITFSIARRHRDDPAAALFSASATGVLEADRVSAVLHTITVLAWRVRAVRVVVRGSMFLSSRSSNRVANRTRDSWTRVKSFVWSDLTLSAHRRTCHVIRRAKVHLHR